MSHRLAFLLCDLSEAERATRVRELRALALAYVGPHHDVSRRLDAAITDPAQIDTALAALAALPALSRRRLLATFGALHSQAPTRRPRARRSEDA